jgi:hypothetical protein
MQEKYSDLDPILAKRVRATPYKNLSKIAKLNLASSLKQDFLQHEIFFNSIHTYVENGLQTVYYTLSPDSDRQPAMDQENCSIVLPVQHNLMIQANEVTILNMVCKSTCRPPSTPSSVPAATSTWLSTS